MLLNEWLLRVFVIVVVVVSKVVIEQRWYAHRALRNLLVHEMYPLGIGTAEARNVCFAIQHDPHSNDIDFNVTIPGNAEFNGMAGFTKIAETNTTSTVKVALVHTNIGSMLASEADDEDVVYCANISAQRPLIILVVLATSLDSDGTDPIDQVQSMFVQYATMSITVSGRFNISGIPSSLLLDQHIDAWSELWMAGMEVSGDKALSRAINSSLYYILSSIREDWPYSLSPGSLSSNSYNGHVFWDTETWMYPPLLMLHPALARSLLVYRHSRIQFAREKAASYGKNWNGTMFPWESAFTGIETTPTIAHTGQLEHHISGDIAFAARQFYLTQVASENEESWNFARDVILDLALGIADFWQSRATPRTRSSKNTQLTEEPIDFDIDGVIPPDEYAENVNNSVFTNAIAQISLEFAARLAEEFEVDDSNHDVGKWKSVAKGLHVLFDSLNNVHPEFEGYNGQTIKQADVVLLGFPLMWGGLNNHPNSRQKDLEYYENRTDLQGPAMTWGMHAIGWLETGDLVRASPLFQRSFANVHEPFDVWTESPTGGAINFITGAGGFLQAVLFGFGGLRVEDPAAGENSTFQYDHRDVLQNAAQVERTLRWSPMLPQNVDFMRFRGVKFLSQILDIEFNATTVTLTLRGSSKNTPAIPLSLQDPDGNVVQLHPTCSVSFARKPSFFVFKQKSENQLFELLPILIGAIVIVSIAGLAAIASILIAVILFVRRARFENYTPIK